MGVEVDDHPDWDDTFAKLSALPNLRHWLVSLNGGRQGAVVLTITIDVLVSSLAIKKVCILATCHPMCRMCRLVRLPRVWFQIYQAECRCRSECMCDLCRAFASTIRADHGIRLGYALCDVHVWRIELEDWFSFVGYVAPIFDAVLV